MEEKKISISAQTSALKIDQDYYRYHFSLLIPDEEIPFSVSVFFKGKYLEIIKRGGIATLKLISSMYLEKNYFFYVLSGEKDLFDIWLKRRHHFHVLPRINLSEKNNIIEHRIKQMIKYGDECFRFLEDNISYRQRKSNALANLRQVCFHPSMRWYFNQEWPQESMNHCTRLAVFSLLLNEFLDDQKIEMSYFFVQSLIIHELGEFIKHEIDSTSATQTLNILKEKQLAFDQKVINYIQDQLELVSGLGKPKGKKGDELTSDQQIFSLINYFDHYRQSFVNLTKAKSTAEAIARIQETKDDYHPVYLTAFISLLEKIELLY